MSARHRALNSRRWERTRRAVFERDGWRCRECARAGRLEAHHEPPLEELPADADPYDLDGIITLCRRCHMARHAGPREGQTEAEREWLAFMLELSSNGRTKDDAETAAASRAVGEAPEGQ